VLKVQKTLSTFLLKQLMTTLVEVRTKTKSSHYLSCKLILAHGLGRMLIFKLEWQ